MIKSDIQEFIDEEINPSLQMHGGYILIESFDENTNILKISMGGGCQGCGSSAETLNLMIENAFREEFPDIAKIEDITDHDAGANPFHT